MENQSYAQYSHDNFSDFSVRRNEKQDFLRKPFFLTMVVSLTPTQQLTEQRYIGWVITVNS